MGRGARGSRSPPRPPSPHKKWEPSHFREELTVRYAYRTHRTGSDRARVGADRSLIALRGRTRTGGRTAMAFRNAKVARLAAGAAIVGAAGITGAVAVAQTGP